MEHYSERLKRNFVDDDWLSIQEVKDVLDANSGRAIGQEYCSYVMNRDNVQTLPIGDKMHIYLYGDLKNIKVENKRGPKPGARALSSSPVAIRQREFKARQREKKALELRENQAEYKPD